MITCLACTQKDRASSAKCHSESVGNRERPGPSKGAATDAVSHEQGPVGAKLLSNDYRDVMHVRCCFTFVLWEFYGGCSAYSSKHCRQEAEGNSLRRQNEHGKSVLTTPQFLFGYWYQYEI